MGKRYLAVVVLLLLLHAGAAWAAPSQIKVSVFNFGTANLEASGLGTTVSNMLIGLLIEDKSLAMLERKELEAFLGMNDLQQNDNIDNVVNIGARLGLNVIIVGAVEKKGSMIMVQCRAIEIDQKKPILTARASALGDAALAAEIKKLSQQIRTAISEQIAKGKAAESSSFPPPVQVRKRPGSRSIQLNWEDAPGAGTVAGYEIFRGTSEDGPFSRLAQAPRQEYVDESVDKDTLYYYKIRAYNDRGLQSEFSQVVNAKTAVTQNPPVILKAEGHVKGIALTWSPGPGSGDPLPLKGYRLYRARAEQGPYREMVNIESRGLGDVTAVIDRLLKVPYLDKGLEDGQEYHYRVTAYNEKDMESGFSRSIRAVTTPAVGSVTAEGNFIREIRLSWPAIDSPFIRGYQVYRSKDEKENFARIKRIEFSASSPGKKIEFADKEGLGDQTRYYYRVTAFEEGDTETSPSPTVSAVTRGKPVKPEEFKAEGGLVKRVNLTWKASTAEDVEGYKLYWSKEKEGQFQHLKTLSGRTTDRYLDDARGFDKLEDGTVYHYRLTTYNRVDVESEPTPLASATTKLRPSKPTDLRGESAKAKSVPLRWSANPEKDIVAYHLFRGTGAEGSDFERIAKIQGTETIDKGLKDDTLYRYRLQAEDKDGLVGAFSETVTVRTKARPIPMQGAEGRVSDGKAVLTWKASPEPDIANYTIYEKKFFGPEKIATVRETTFSEPAPPKGKTKTYLVTATDKDGLESDPGQEMTVMGP